MSPSRELSCHLQDHLHGVRQILLDVLQTGFDLDKRDGQDDVSLEERHFGLVRVLVLAVNTGHLQTSSDHVQGQLGACIWN